MVPYGLFAVHRAFIHLMPLTHSTSSYTGINLLYLAYKITKILKLENSFASCNCLCELNLAKFNKCCNYTVIAAKHMGPINNNQLGAGPVWLNATDGSQNITTANTSINICLRNHNRNQQNALLKVWSFIVTNL